MIRVLQFADVINRHDFIDTIIRGADRRRFHLGACVTTRKCNIADPEYSAELPFWRLQGESRAFIVRSAWRLAHILRKWQAHIVHTHHYDQALIGWLATRFYPRTRLVVGRHYSDAIYRSTRGLKQRVLLGLEQLVNRAAARIVVPSAYIWEILTKKQHVDPHKVDLVHYGFVPEKYTTPLAADVQRLRRDLGLEGTFSVATFARLHEEKGHRYLLDALALLRERMPNLHLLVVGEGPERAALQQQVRALQLGDRVQLLGWRQDAMLLMAAADAIVQPTLQEAFSQVMVEALWMRKPLVITDVSGAPDIIADGQNGFLVPKANPTALAEAIVKLGGDPRLRDRLATGGRNYVEEKVLVDRIIPLYERVYLRALET